MISSLSKKISECLKKVLSNYPEAFAVIDEDNIIMYINNEFEKLFAFKYTQVIGCDINKLIIPERFKDEAVFLSKLVCMGKNINRECIRSDKYRQEKYVKITSFPIKDINNRKLFMISYQDISDNQKREQVIKHLTYHDNITGLHNRYYIEKKILNKKVLNKHPLTIIIGDINGLKSINNKKGFSYGNSILKKTADIIKRTCQNSDVISRWAEDEFLIMISGKDIEEVNIIIDHLKIEMNKAAIDFSFGTASCNKPGKTIKELITEAANKMCINKLNISKSSSSKIITSMHKLMIEKSYETEEHIQRLKKYVYRIGDVLNLSDYNINKLLLLSQLHDIGKIAVPNSILNKPGSLNKGEWEIIKSHPGVGYRIACAFNELEPIAEDILSHHERWDGRGYPNGLTQDKIPFLARIIAIIDSYDVMTHKRSYKTAMTTETAKKELQVCAGKQFDPEVVDLFIINSIFD